MEILVKNILKNNYLFINDIDYDDTIYVNKHRIIYLDKYGIKFKDYYAIRDLINNCIIEMGGFNILKDIDKAIVIKYTKLVSQEDAITYLMNLGNSLEIATNLYIKNLSIDMQNAADACKQRINNNVMIFIALKYMSPLVAMQFLDAIKEHIFNYERIAHLGINYGANKDGIMDYIESTNVYANGGLKLYTFNNSYTFEQCRDEFKNLLVYGIKPVETL